MEILSAKGVNFTYADASESVLNEINFTIYKGDFVVFCGPSGSGKSTLLRLIKKEIAPYGDKQGTFFYQKKSIEEHDPLYIAKEIGMVFQDPENQIVMDNVMDELLFGMENVGFSTTEMRKKVAEMVHFFGLNHLVNKKTSELSGGEKQLINLASILLLNPKLILLDEPTAQLDPIASKEFIHFLQRINDEFGITIIIVEHRLEELFAVSNRVMMLDNGKITVDTEPRHAVGKLHHNMRNFLPTTALVYLDFNPDICLDEIPITVKESRQWLLNQKISGKQLEPTRLAKGNPLVELKEIDYQYTKHTPPVLQNLSFTVNHGEWMAIVGANGTGKSTLLKIIGNILKPQHGYIKLNGKKVKQLDPTIIGYLPQNPKVYFLQDSLIKEYRQIVQKQPKKEKDIDYLLEKFQIQHLKNRHPYDLSGGELQKAALIGILLTNPSLLLIDEPTKGMDPDFKDEFGELITDLVEEGLTVIMVTHDIEFAAKHTTKCSMLFQGNITVTENTREFFLENAYYTTAISRITRDSHVPSAVTLEEAKKTWQNQSGS
ncbi:ABC transporter ATP-binding protein [Oceanobacillus halotolerans]|uniref:ABC transporter ATP-binding protein n=1 Tax=Oceanobacillus halotolerans TaxID=2663380 RepID=UPI0013DAFDC7|nr:ABC transporter ATP-binding protein [Oceanobacillus halotolerans]